MDRRTERKESGSHSPQLGQRAQEAKGMLGIVLLPPHLNIGSQLCEAVCFDSLNIYVRGKDVDPPYMIIRYQEV